MRHLSDCPPHPDVTSHCHGDSPLSGLSHRGWDTAGWKDAATTSWSRDGRVRPQGGFRGPKGFLHSAPEGCTSLPEQGPRQLRHHPCTAHSPAEMPAVSHGVGAGGAELGAYPRGVLGVDGVWRGHAGPTHDRGAAAQCPQVCIPSPLPPPRWVQAALPWVQSKTSCVLWELWGKETP